MHPAREGDKKNELCVASMGEIQKKKVMRRMRAGEVKKRRFVCEIKKWVIQK